MDLVVLDDRAEGMVKIVERYSKKREDVDKEYVAAFVAAKARP